MRMMQKKRKRQWKPREKRGVDGRAAGLGRWLERRPHLTQSFGVRRRRRSGWQAQILWLHWHGVRVRRHALQQRARDARGKLFFEIVVVAEGGITIGQVGDGGVDGGV